jgi:hypothetical protein
MPTCSYDGCERKYYALGWCEMHWRRVRKYGNPEGGPTTHAPAEVRFWRGVEKKGPDDCWLYTRGAKRGVYGLFQPGGKDTPHVGAHRFSCELVHGPIPKGMVVMHSCDTPKCVNPAHLSVGTYKDNSQDMISKGRHARVAPLGKDNGKSILTEEMVIEIKTSKARHIDLARKFNVSSRAVRDVRSGRTWRHLNPPQEANAGL